MSKQKLKQSSKKLIPPENLIREKQEEKIMKSLNPTVLKQQIYEYKRRINQLIGQLNKLNIEMAKSNQNHLSKTYDFQQKIKQQQNTLNKLKQQYKQINQENKSKYKEMKLSWQKEKNEFNNKKNKQTNEINQKCRQLTKKLENIEIFKTKQNEYIKHIEQLKKKTEKLEINHKQQLNKIKQDHSKIRNQIEQDSKRQIQNIKQIQYINAQDKLGEKQKNTQKQNQILYHQIQLYQQQEKALIKQSQKIQAEIQQQQRILKQMNLITPTNQNHQRSLKIINLQEKMNQLKTYITQESKKLQQQEKKVKIYYQENQKELNKQIKKSNDIIKKKEKQIKDIRMYSQMVLDQRGHLQWYLLEVINQHQDLKLEKVQHIDDILRFLFTKINSGIPPKNWRKLDSNSVTFHSKTIVEQSQPSQQKIQS